MSADFDLQSFEMSEVFEGVAAMLLAPIVLPLASAVNQPLVKNVLKEGIALSERCQEAVADAQERLEDAFAEAKAAVEADYSGTSDSTFVQRPDWMPKERPSYQRVTGQFTEESAQATVQLEYLMSDLNDQVRWLTNDLFDLRILASAALGAYAFRQILTRGFSLDELPWYVLAWYALDTFVKFSPNPKKTEPTSAASSGRTNNASGYSSSAVQSSAEESTG